MMDALLIGLFVIILANAWLVDRMLKRHAAHVERLLHWRHDPKAAALADMPPAELLYLPPEDDAAWNEHHRKGD